MFCPLSIDWGNVAQWISGIAAAAAVFYALFRDNIQQRWQRHNLKFLEVINIQQGSIWIYRLVINNDSKYIAKNIEFDIEELIVNGQRRKNFLPAPLNWTHTDGKSQKDIFPHQTAYLDILTTNFNRQGIPLALYTPALWSILPMVKIEKGTTVLKLKYYSENGQTGNINIQVKWKGNSTSEEEYLPEVDITD